MPTSCAGTAGVRPAQCPVAAAAGISADRGFDGVSGRSPTNPLLSIQEAKERAPALPDHAHCAGPVEAQAVLLSLDGGVSFANAPGQRAAAFKRRFNPPRLMAREVVETVLARCRGGPPMQRQSSRPT